MAKVVDFACKAEGFGCRLGPGCRACGAGGDGGGHCPGRKVRPRRLSKNGIDQGGQGPKTFGQKAQLQRDLKQAELL